MKKDKMNKVKNNLAKPILWTISGADCSGGAGIAADIKTGHGLGVEVCTLITANTVQNSQQVFSVNAVDADVLQQQFDALKDDKPPRVIKIGLLANAKQVVWLVSILEQLKQQKAQQNRQLTIVYDPVGQASVGGSLSLLTNEDLQPLLEMVDVLTPNAKEAKQLALGDNKTSQQQADFIQQLGVTSVIIKGGHSADTELCEDFCFSPVQPTGEIGAQQCYRLTSPRIRTNNNHGGGCSFATALSAFIAHGYLLRDAFTLAKAFINVGLSKNIQQKYIQLEPSNSDHNAPYYGAFEQTGWPMQAKYFPQVTDELNREYKNLSAFPTLELSNNEKLGLYPVVDSVVWIDRLLKVDVKIIQLRIKLPDNKSVKELSFVEEKISQAIKLCKGYPDTRLFINDHWQLAIKHGAYGVHIGQEDIKNADLVAIQQAGLRLGISTHGCYEFLLAQQVKPSYLAIGAIFPTKTKNMSGQIQGLKNLALTLNLAGDIPVVAIGGISLARTPKVWDTGVRSIAVVTAITEAEEPEEVAKQFKEIIK
jgi:hydroxymethylpyrimidine kinase / phosphomethylpyrimidine kinase / thiamine-phosphate diphosphorylase